MGGVEKSKSRGVVVGEVEVEADAPALFTSTRREPVS